MREKARFLTTYWFLLDFCTASAGHDCDTYLLNHIETGATATTCPDQSISYHSLPSAAAAAAGRWQADDDGRKLPNHQNRRLAAADLRRQVVGRKSTHIKHVLVLATHPFLRQ